MILRRITQHVKDQNWFAVFLDFFIVVAGILIAFQITNWNEDRSARAELSRAETDLQTDLLFNYFNAKERLSLKECRITRLRELSERLLKPGDMWEGMLHQYGSPSNERAIERVLHSPHRSWGSRNWDAELARGTFSLMDAERRELLDGLFALSADAQRTQDQIHRLQGRLKILGHSTEIPRTDRLRYYDIVSEIDEQSFWLENFSGQIVRMIDDLGIELDEAYRIEFRGDPATYFKERVEIYGPCVKPIEISYLDPPNTEASK